MVGPDEYEIKNLVMCPINPDGSFGEPIELDGLKPITEYPETTMYMESFKYLTKTASGTLKLDSPRKISRKKFKKWLMSRGFDRNFAEWFCTAVKSFHGDRSYRSLYLCGLFASGPQTLFNNLFDVLFPI